MIGIQKVLISIKARRINNLHKKAGCMTDALYFIKKYFLTRTGRSMHDGAVFGYKIN